MVRIKTSIILTAAFIFVIFSSGEGFGAKERNGGPTPGVQKRAKTDKSPKKTDERVSKSSNSPKVQKIKGRSVNEMGMDSKSIQAVKRRELPKFRHFDQTLSMEKLLRLAIKYNPTLIRLRRKASVSKERERKAGVWPDLNAGISVLNFPMNSFNPSDTPMSGIQYTLSQRFPILKRLGLQKEIAKLQTEIDRADISEVSHWIEFAVKKEVFLIWFLHRSLEIWRELHALTGQAAEVARSKYAVGRASQQNYLLAYTLQAQIRNRMIEIISKEKRARFRLWQLLGSSLDVVNYNLPPLKELKEPPEREKLKELAFSRRGAISRWKIAEKKAQTILSLGKVKYWPDVTLSLSIRQRFPNKVDPGYPFISVGVKVPIPSWGNPARYGLIKEAMALHQFAAARLQELQIKIKEQIKLMLQKIEQYNRQMKIYRQRIIPLAEQTYRASLSSYKVDRVDFINLLNDLKTLYRHKLEYDRLKYLKALTLAKLEAVTGGKF